MVKRYKTFEQTLLERLNELPEEAKEMIHELMATELSPLDILKEVCDRYPEAFKEW